MRADLQKPLAEFGESTVLVALNIVSPHDMYSFPFSLSTLWFDWLYEIELKRLVSCCVIHCEIVTVNFRVLITIQWYKKSFHARTCFTFSSSSMIYNWRSKEVHHHENETKILYSLIYKDLLCEIRSPALLIHTRIVNSMIFKQFKKFETRQKILQEKCAQFLCDFM